MRSLPSFACFASWKQSCARPIFPELGGPLTSRLRRSWTNSSSPVTVLVWAEDLLRRARAIMPSVMPPTGLMYLMRDVCAPPENESVFIKLDKSSISAPKICVLKSGKLCVITFHRWIARTFLRNEEVLLLLSPRSRYLIVN